MKKLIAVTLAVAFVLALAGCATPNTNNSQKPTGEPSVPSQPSVPPTSLPEPTGPSLPAQKPMASISVPTVTEDTKAADGTVIFQYVYQNISLILPDPDVANNVLKDLEGRIDATKATAELLRQQAQTNYNGSADWYAYQYQILFEPQRIDHGVLSLLGTAVNFSGAKAEHSYQGANYDLVNGKLIHLLDIFTKDDWATSVSPLVTDALTAVKDQYELYDDFAMTVQTRFSGDLSGDTHWYFTQNGLCFFFAPYEVAPYSSGVITAEIPYEKLSDILKPEYFPAERDLVDGKIITEVFSPADMTKFTQISELTLDSGGISMLLHADTAVHDVRISVLSLAGKPNYTAFASYTMTPGDAVMLQIPVTQDQILTLSYVSNGTTVTETITLPEVSG